MANSVLQKIIQGGAKVAEAAAPIVGGIVGGPAGAAIGTAASKGIKKVASARALGGPSAGQGGAPSFTPSSASSIDEARAQDKQRMSDRYGVDPRD
jgi:hypothetical protein